MSADDDKKKSAEAVVELVEDGMDIGMGTGSTAVFAVKKLAERVRGGLKVRGLPTSQATADLARAEGIPLLDFSDVTTLALTMDGADEMDPALNLIKGGGGALFREKIVAAASETLIIFADESKRVKTLGAFPLPIEVNPFGWQVVERKIKALGASVTLRANGNQPFITDNQGYILDCAFGTIPDPPALDAKISAITGVVETGLFIHLAKAAYISKDGQVTRYTPQ